MDRDVRAERAAPAAVFERWRTARRAAIAALQQADPAQRLRWAAAPLKPTTLATTRLAEHWAHGLDITGPLDIPFPDTDRLRHIAWLAQSSLPYAFTLVGEEPHDVFCELTAPDGATWRYGQFEAKRSPAADAAVLRANAEWFGRAVGEAGRDSAGMIDEYRAFVSAWGFGFADITIPVHVYQGTADELVPPAWASDMTKAIPGATLTTFDGEGHFIAISHRADIVGDLLAPTA